jgi:hypothetical protein
MGFTIQKDHIMNKQHLAAIATLGILLVIPSISLGQGKVLISSPADGATLDALDETKLVYAIDPGPKGDHAHLYIDDKEVAILRKLKGSYALNALSFGKRSLCVKVVNKAHVPIGIGQCIQVTVE